MANELEKAEQQEEEIDYTVDNPYKLLGVRKNASDKAIKDAFRKACLKAHPDVGGNPENFYKITQAYRVLIDPKKRALYDRTGIFLDESDPEVDRLVAQNLASLFEAALNQGIADTTDQDLIAAMLKYMKEQLPKHREDEKKFANEMEQLQKLRKRLKRKKGAKGGKNIFDEIAVQKTAMLEQNLEKAQMALKVTEATILELQNYEFLVDMVYRVTPVFYGWSTSSNTTSTSTSA